MDPIEQLHNLFEVSQKIVFFTGAGISTESGIADFRSPGGIWSKIKPIEYSDFLEHEDIRLEDWRRRFHFQKEFDAATPNFGHMFIADVLNSGRGLAVITQNIDGLHQRAGVPDNQIVEIHGNGTKATCLECQSPMSLLQAKELIASSEKAPRCQRCNGLVKAAVISFGQPMPQNKVSAAKQWAEACDLFVVLGSSLVVQPAASIPVIAQRQGAKLVILNREPTHLDAAADLVLHAPIGETLKRVQTFSGYGMH